MEPDKPENLNEQYKFDISDIKEHVPTEEEKEYDKYKNEDILGKLYYPNADKGVMY